MLSSYFYDVTLRVKQLWKKTCSKISASKTSGWHRNGLGSFCMEIIAYKGRPFSVFVNGFVYHFALLQLYSNHLVLSLRNLEVESNDGSHLELLDALEPGRRIFEKCALARWRPNGNKIKCPIVSQILTNRALNLCNNSYQTLFSNTLTFARSLGRCFQHLPRDLVNVNVWKTMFDSYINTLGTFRYFWNLSVVRLMAVCEVRKVVFLLKQRFNTLSSRFTHPDTITNSEISTIVLARR